MKEKEEEDNVWICCWLEWDEKVKCWLSRKRMTWELELAYSCAPTFQINCCYTHAHNEFTNKRLDPLFIVLHTLAFFIHFVLLNLSFFTSLITSTRGSWLYGLIVQVDSDTMLQADMDLFLAAQTTNPASALLLHTYWIADGYFYCKSKSTKKQNSITNHFRSLSCLWMLMVYIINDMNCSSGWGTTSPLLLHGFLFLSLKQHGLPSFLSWCIAIRKLA